MQEARPGRLTFSAVGAAREPGPYYHTASGLDFKIPITDVKESRDGAPSPTFLPRGALDI